MSKGILVVDMPESCDMCDFAEHEHENGVFNKMYCGVPGMGEDVSDCIACRPDFCPLVPMPERKDPRDNSIYRYGWNHCLDAIGGKTN